MKRKELWVYALLIVLSCLTLIVNAQTYPHRQYTVRDGLVQGQVTALMQDSKGYIWAGTKGGVSRFDGREFVNFTKRNGLPANYVWDIKEDSKGNVWFSTRAGLAKYDGYKMTKYYANHFRPKWIAIDGEDNIWITNHITKGRTRSDSINSNPFLYFFDVKTEEYKQVNLEVEKHITNPRSINYDKKNDRILYGGTLHKDGKQIPKNYLGSRILSVTKNGIEVLDSSDTYSNILIDSRSSNLFLLKNHRKKVNGKYQFDKSTIASLKDTTIILIEYTIPIHSYAKIGVHPNGTFYHLTPLGDNQVRKSKGKKIETIDANFATISHLIIDKENTLWLGTEQGLVHYVSEAFKNYDIPYVWSIQEDENNNLLLGSFFRGLYQLNPSTGDTIDITKRYKHLFKGRQDKGFYFGAIKEDNGKIYFPLSHQILTYHNGQFDTIIPPHEQAILYIYEDKEKDWLLLGKQGLQIIDKQGREIAFYNEENGMPIYSYVLGIEKDKYGNYWAGQGGSLCKITPDGKVTEYRDKAGTFPSRGVISITKDYKGNLWFGTVDDGIVTYDYDNDKFIKVGWDKVYQGVPFITTVDSNLVLGSEHEVLFFDLKEYYKTGKENFTAYSYNNGFTVGEVGQQGVFKDSKGKIWFTSSDYLVQLDPKKLPKKTPTYTPRLTTISTKKTEMAKWEETSFKKTENYEFSNATKYVKIDWDLIAFAQPRPIRYRYKLFRNSKKEALAPITIDSTWSEEFERSEVTFQRLRWGNYTLALVAYNSKDEPGEIVTLSFKIKKAFYQKWWFWVLVAGILIGIGRLFFLERTKRYRRRMRELEIEKENQALKLAKITTERERDKLNSTLLSTQMRTHFISNALAGLEVFTDSDEANTYISELGTLTRKFLEFSYKRTVSLEEEIKMVKKYIRIQAFRFYGKFEYEENIDEEILNESIPPMLIQPFVENATEHGLKGKLTEQGKLWLTIKELEDETIQIIIADNGIGIKKAKRLKALSGNQRKGYGMEIVHKKIEDFNKHTENKKIDLIINELYPDRENTGTQIIILIKTKN